MLIVCYCDIWWGLGRLIPHLVEGVSSSESNRERRLQIINEAIA